MNTLQLAWLGPFLVLGFRILVDAVPMYPLNDLTKKTGKSRVRDLTLHYLPLTAMGTALLSESGFVRILGLLLALLYLAGYVAVWLLPYAVGTTQEVKAKRERPYLRTHRVLPPVKDHLVPDTAHVIHGLLTVLMVVGATAFILSGGAAELDKPSTPAAAKPAETAQPIVTAFTQAGEQPEKLLIETMLGAKSTLDIAIYAINHEEIVDAIIRAKINGVQVRVITDRSEAAAAAQTDKLKKLAEAGIPIKENTRKGLMHLKMALIDDTTVATGSFNYTTNASTLNDEVLLVLKDSKTARRWKDQFETMWKDTQNFRDLKPSGR